MQAPTFEETEGGSGRFLLLAAVPSWFISMVVHAIMIIILALFTYSEVDSVVQNLVVPQPEPQEELEDFELEDIVEVDVQAFENTVGPEMTNQPLQVETMTTDDFLTDDLDVAPVAIELSDFGEKTAPKNDLLGEIGAVTGTGVSGRGSAKMRGKLAMENGGSKGSEAAVAAALRWLAAHQMADGGWSFDHRPGRCRGQCDHAGTAVRARNGATALALLPFLGAGQTHLEGKYKKEVEAGLMFLGAKQKNDGSFNEPEGSMYSHGLCAIVLCEAFAMTHDKRLAIPAQASIDFIISAQDPVGGGWRYSPRQAGDTSAVGWQLMALKSGHMGYLQVPPNTIHGAKKFLDSVSRDAGALYGYTGPQGGSSACTAVGLLSRMYLGWDKEHPSLQKGVAYLSRLGPSKTNGGGNMYYNYYATQVMRHYEGEEWKKWNEAMRDWLVNSQAKTGHMEGSWAMGGDHGSERGGRLYCTAMATMILEVYYRHMPIYRKAAAKEDFPL